MITIHIVKQGDTVYNLSKIYQTTPLSIIEDNGLTNPNELIIGQSLIIVKGEPRGLEYIDVYGYSYTSIKDKVLFTALPHMSAINIFNYMVTAKGELITIEDEELIQNAFNYQVAPIMVLTNLIPDGGFSSEIIQTILENEEIQDKLIDNVLGVMKEKGYYGVDADFEYIPAGNKESYEGFLREFATRLHAEGYKLSVALAPKNRKEQRGILYEAHDYEIIGDIADKVLLMTYEWGYILGPPLAVAPINEVEKVISYAVTEIDSKKILMGIPNYGYNWRLPYEEGVKATVVSNPEAVWIAKRFGAEIEFDLEAQAPFFTYYDTNKKQHIVWFEDARSISKKLELVEKYQLGGIFYWTIMKPFPQNWTVLENTYNTVRLI